MAFKMRGFSAFDKGPGDKVDFTVKESAKDKAQRDLDMMKLGSRFDESGKRKKGEAKKMAKMTRKYTGLDQQKYDRDAKKQKTSFRGKKGQEGLDKLKEKQKKKSSGGAKRKKARATRKAARSQKQSLARGAGSGWQGAGCGAYE